MSIAFVNDGCSHLLGRSGLIKVVIIGLMMTTMCYLHADINHASIHDVLLAFNTMAEICIVLIFGLLVNPFTPLPALSVELISAAGLMLVVRPLRMLVLWCGSDPSAARHHS